jgi:integrase
VGTHRRPIQIAAIGDASVPLVTATASSWAKDRTSRHRFFPPSTLAGGSGRREAARPDPPDHSLGGDGPEVSLPFRRIVRELELPRTRFHDLRHAHATQLLAAGIHPKAVSERLGHSSTSFTMDTYSAVIPSMGRAAADAADQLFGEGGR